MLKIVIGHVVIDALKFEEAQMASLYLVEIFIVLLIHLLIFKNLFIEFSLLNSSSHFIIKTIKRTEKTHVTTVQ